MNQTPATVTVDGKEYEFEKLSSELQEMVALYLHARELMNSARRQATIHEVAVINLGATIKARVEAETNGRQSDPFAGR